MPKRHGTVLKASSPISCFCSASSVLQHPSIASLLTLPANIIEQLTLLKLHDKRKKKQTKSSYSVFNLCISIECRTFRTTAKNYTNGASKTCYKRQQNRALYSHQNKTSKLIQTIPLIHVFTQDRKDNDLLHMLSISKHADLHFGAGYVWQLNRATEPLVLLGVIVFQTNL